MAVSSRVFRTVRNFSFKRWGGSKWAAAGWMLSQLRSALGADSSVKADLKTGRSVWHPPSKVMSVGVRLWLTYQTVCCVCPCLSALFITLLSPRSRSQFKPSSARSYSYWN